MRAKPRFHQKVTLLRSKMLEVGIAELKVFDVPKSAHYPEGLKYSLFLVLKESGRIVVGMDNHRPKGPHLHIGDEEKPYTFRGVEGLVEDFWQLAQKEGFEL